MLLLRLLASEQPARHGMPWEIDFRNTNEYVDQAKLKRRFLVDPIPAFFRARKEIARLQQGRARVEMALDAVGRWRFFDLFFENPGFKACPQCPHNV